jgi:hypothetical protein
MILPNRINQAYDNLNLPRGASLQSARDRMAVLRLRFASETDSSKRNEAESAFKILEQADIYMKSQREAISSRTKTRSERILEEKLATLPDQPRKVSLEAEVIEDTATAKRLRSAEGHREEAVKQELVTSAPSDANDAKVFEKLQGLLKDESKYFRAMNVLFNLVKAFADGIGISPLTLTKLQESIDVAVISTNSSGLPLANLDEEHRRASTRIINLVLATEQLKSAMDKEYIELWSHSVLFRNSLFELDNFIFVRRCKEILEIISDLKKSPREERWLKQILLTLQSLSSKGAYKIVPGRINDTKSTMTEVFKMTRDPAYPAFFRERIAELQRGFMSSLS